MTPAAALIKPSRSTSSGVPLIDTISSSFFHRDRRAAGFGQLAGRDRERDRTGQARELMARRDEVRLYGIGLAIVEPSVSNRS